MKAIPVIAAATIFTLTVGSSPGAESKRTAEYILSDPQAHLDKELSLDVAMVSPVRWVSPLPEFAFFHAMTIDRRDKKSGGPILVAVPSSESADFAKKYGTDFDGRSNSRVLRGELISVGKGNHGRGSGLWLIDTTGKLLAAIEAKKAEMPAEAFLVGGDAGVGPGPGRGGPKRTLR